VIGNGAFDSASGGLSNVIFGQRIPPMYFIDKYPLMYFFGKYQDAVNYQYWQVGISWLRFTYGCVELPKTLEKVRERAFAGCINMRRIAMPLKDALALVKVQLSLFVGSIKMSRHLLQRCGEMTCRKKLLDSTKLFFQQHLEERLLQFNNGCNLPLPKWSITS